MYTLLDCFSFLASLFTHFPTVPPPPNPDNCRQPYFHELSTLYFTAHLPLRYILIYPPDTASVRALRLRQQRMTQILIAHKKRVYFCKEKKPKPTHLLCTTSQASASNTDVMHQPPKHTHIKYTDFPCWCNLL